MRLRHKPTRPTPIALAPGVIAAVALACAIPAVAQQAPASYARTVVIVPKPGQADAFEKGYERHLQWHKGARDPWTWYGWTFVLGNRINRFMDGTFGHAAADFDAAVQPAATLGTPYTLSGLVDRVDNELLRYRPNLSYRP
jgi:hypothetical protein